MKRFMYIFCLLLILSFCVVAGKTSLAVYSKGVESQKCTDLGFLIEENKTINFKNYKKGSQIVGECVTIDASLLNLNQICERLGINITKKYELGDRLIIEGYSPLLNYYIEGRQENVQLCLNDEELTIATPIIYGSY